jgi:hypothetical protein
MSATRWLLFGNRGYIFRRCSGCGRRWWTDSDRELCEECEQQEGKPAEKCDD